MRISDEDLAEMVRDSYCKDAGCKRCNAVKDLRDLRKAAAPFITHSAKLATQSNYGKAYVLIEVPVDDILNLRRELKGS